MNNKLIDTENGTLEMFDNTWYIHPLYKGWASSESGDILYISKKKILKPKMTDMGFVIYVSYKYEFVLKLVHEFVFEIFNDIEEVNGTIKHIDGNKANNSINNLELV